jgi:hypothetical protein
MMNPASSSAFSKEQKVAACLAVKKFPAIYSSGAGSLNKVKCLTPQLRSYLRAGRLRILPTPIDKIPRRKNTRPRCTLNPEARKKANTANPMPTARMRITKFCKELELFCILFTTFNPYRISRPVRSFTSASKFKYEELFNMLLFAMVSADMASCMPRDEFQQVHRLFFTIQNMAIYILTDFILSFSISQFVSEQRYTTIFNLPSLLEANRFQNSNELLPCFGKTNPGSLL